MARTLRVGLIGAGTMGLVHYDQLMATRRVTIAALVDPSKRSLAAFRKERPDAESIPDFADYQDMLKKVKLDAVAIASPHAFHYEQASACLGKDLHVLCEKPLAGSVREVKLLIRKANTKERVLLLCYQRHYQPMFRYMRERIASGAIGAIQYVQATQAQEWHRLTKGTWRQRKEQAIAGQILDSGSHLIDIVLWVTGLKAKKVYAKLDNLKTEVDINSTLSITFQNGALGSLAIIGNAPSWHEDVTIVGSKGAFYLRHGQGLVHLDPHGKPVPLRLPDYLDTPDSNFIKCILGKEESQALPECGLRAMELTEAAWKSSETGAPVTVR